MLFKEAIIIFDYSILKINRSILSICQVFGRSYPLNMIIFAIILKFSEVDIYNYFYIVNF